MLLPLQIIARAVTQGGKGSPCYATVNYTKVNPLNETFFKSLTINAKAKC